MTKRREGFTLIELMIVVTIIGILAAVAIPNFLKFQLRSKTGEAKANLAAIRTTEEAYFSEHGTYLIAAQTPVGASTNLKRAWPTPNATFDPLSWAPEGEVFFVYGVNYLAATPSQFTAAAQGDLDGDTTFSNFAYVHATVAPGVAFPGFSVGCNTNGTYDAGTMLQDLLNTVGPCSQADGESQF